jgi:hypothetical protein
VARAGLGLGPGVVDDLRVALPPWLAGRVLVACTLVGAHAVRSFLHPAPSAVRHHVAQGLLGWDAERYVNIARFGYAPLPRIEIRFFPLVPLATRALDVVLPGGAGVALLVLANVAALLFVIVLHRLVVFETGDRELARRAAWFGAIMPAGFVLAWGYTESLWAALATGAFLAARRGRWWTAALLALLVGAIRPVGVLIAVPLAIEAARGLRRPAWSWSRRRSWPWPAAAAVLSSFVGAGAYLWWVGATFGDPLLPYRIQQGPKFRGPAEGPWTALQEPAHALLAGTWDVGSIRVVWAVALVALIAVSFRRWPVSYGAFATVSLVVALSTSHLGSFERYTFTTFPVVLAMASLSSRAWVERSFLAVGAATMTLYGLLALLGAYTP